MPAPLRALVWPLLFASACTLPGGKSGGDDDDDDDDDSATDADDTTAPVDASWSTGDDDDDFGTMNAEEFYVAWYDLMCDQAIDCNSSTKVLDLWCNTDPSEFTGLESGTLATTECSFDPDLGEACLDEPIFCGNYDEPVPPNVCLIVVDCD